MLPPLVRGEHKACFAVTEPNAGLDTTRIKTAAKRTNAGYVIDGQKIWTTTAQHASHIMVLARTTPYEECAKKTQGAEPVLYGLRP
jgi:acyl-CoA dehydrogenase